MRMRATIAVLVLLWMAGCAEPIDVSVPIEPEPVGTVLVTGLPAGVQAVDFQIHQQEALLGRGDAVRPQGDTAVLGLRSLPEPGQAAVIDMALLLGEGVPGGQTKSVSYRFNGLLAQAGPISFSAAFVAFATFLPAPDGRPYPGSPFGDPIPDPRGTDVPRGATIRPFIDAVMAAKAQASPLLSGTVTVNIANPNPPPATVPVRVHWQVRPDGSCRITLSSGEVFDVHHDGDAVRVEYVTIPLQASVHHGESYIFVGTGGDPGTPGHCTDAIWVQYVHRTTQFYRLRRRKVGPLHELGPQVDEQVPYKFQSQDGAAGEPVMEDAPGFGNIALGQGQSLAAVADALDDLKAEHNVDNNSITKAVVTWDFDTYLICLAPVYHIVGHYEWGFTLTVQIYNPRFAKSNVRPPVWYSGF